MQRLGPILLTATLALSACGPGDDDVTVSDAWARASAPTQTSGAVYFDLEVAADDDLVAASVPASIATGAEIHEVVMVDAQMRMKELSDGLALRGGETVSFEPGGYHVMLSELTGRLDVGDEFELTLEFANADAVTVTVEVAETAP